MKNSDFEIFDGAPPASPADAGPSVRSKPRKKNCADGARQLPPPSDPMACSRCLLEEEFSHPDHLLLVQQGGQFYRWDGTCWPAMDDRDVRTLAYRYTENATYWHEKDDGTREERPWRPTQRKIADFIDALRAAAHIPTTIPTPSWLSRGKQPAREVVSCTNGLVHVPTQTLMPHTPRFYVHHAVPYAFNPRAPAPKEWLAFLARLWPDDPESIAALQEIFGYLVTGHTEQQKMFLLVGPKRGGKGTIARVLKGLVGGHNVAGPTLSSLGTNFGLEQLIGKSVGIVADARISGTDTSIIAERLLSISGEDTLTIDRKYREHITAQLPTRFLILSNELPRLADASGALASRFIILVLTQSFYGREDIRLTSKLLAELPAILNWALEGARSLQARGHFLMPASSREAMRELEDLGSPIGAFVRDRCVIDPRKEVTVDLLYEEWKSWSEENGRKVSSKQVFGRDLRAAFPGIKVMQPRGPDGRQSRAYSGIGKADTR